MVLSMILEKLQIIAPDRELLLANYRTHFLFVGDRVSWWPENFPDAYWSPLVQEYLCTVYNTVLGATVLYLILASLSFAFNYKFLREKYLPKFEKSMYTGMKIGYDIKLSLINIFVEAWLVSLLRMWLPRYSLVYYDVGQFGWAYVVLSIFLHMLYDETLTYWAHRWMHTYPWLYEKLHKYHHRSLDITPYSGIAFHPLDAFAQALGTFTSAYFFPVHINVQLFFSFVTPVWALSIHDNVPQLPFKLFLYATHHTIHHEPGIGKMSNYGKFTSVWDRIMGSYCDPDRITFGWKEQKARQRKFAALNDFYDSIVKDTSSSRYPAPKDKKIVA